MTHDSELPVRYRLRTVRLGVQSTWLVLAALTALPLVPHEPAIPLAPYLSVLGAAAAGVLLVAMLPWRRLFERGIGMAFMYAWSAIDIVLITLLLGVVGPDSLDMFLIYGLTTVFFAASYPPSAQVAMLLFTYAAYLTLLGLGGWPVEIGNLVARFALLGIVTFLTSFLSRELMGQISAHSEARAESERRSMLLGAVARAARTISSLDSDRVLGAVVDSALSLGFDAGGICFYDEETNTYRVAHPRGLPEGYSRKEHSASVGLISMVREKRDTVTTEDYSRHPKSEPTLLDAGFRAAIATPVFSGGRLTAILEARTRAPREITEQEREAFELLASIAGRALENAVRFEDEQRAVESLAELDRLKQDFLSTVSHEIRTPLTVIQGAGLTLEQRWEELEESTRLEFIKSLNANARSLGAIIASLLDFSELEDGLLEARPEPVDLAVAIDETLGRLEDIHRDHVMLVELPRETSVIADPSLLDRVLENLISNAAKYSPAGTGILLSANVRGDRMEVAVSDNGPGIPAEEIPRLGERFFRGGDPNSRATKGIGLGLALVREILALLDAQLSVESEVGRGSRFSFSLPLASRGAHLETPAKVAKPHA